MKKILKKITKEISKIDKVIAILLYGSFAREEYTSRSDIDLLILVTEEKIRKKIQDRIIELEYSLKGRSIQPTIRTLKELEKTDTGLLQNIFQEGRVLYLKKPAEIPSAVLLNQKPWMIYTFKINSLGQKNKVKFNRQLYSQERKKYKYKGFLDELGGRKLSPGCILVPYSQKEKIEKFFKKFKVEFKQLKVWK